MPDTLSIVRTMLQRVRLRINHENKPVARKLLSVCAKNRIWNKDLRFVKLEIMFTKIIKTVPHFCEMN